MYFQEAIIENSGPLRNLNLKASFSESGSPKPLILVGSNGTGKTNFLSLIADALFEAAAVHYDNILPAKGVARSWFRVVGGHTVTVGAKSSISILRFDDNGKTLLYEEKSGDNDYSKYSLFLPENERNLLDKTNKNNFKNFTINDDRSRIIFEEGIYTYFPSNRSEIPHWLNKETITETEFDVSQKFSKKIKNPLYIEHALDKFKQWLIGVLSDSKVSFSFSDNHKGTLNLDVNNLTFLSSMNVLSICNEILRAILCDDQVYFVWLGRKAPDKVGIAKGNSLLLPNLDTLSTGQAILLSMFGSILRYGDLSNNNSSTNISSISGICLIDEIDAHMHVDLQYKILPKLIKIFPKIQFILTSHSPLFILGMEKTFGRDGIQIINMPSGRPVSAEAYAEFEKALDALAASQAFSERVLNQVNQKNSKPIIYVEGETDAPYLKRAAKLLEKDNILKSCDIEWIGDRDEKNQGFYTGKDSLRNTLSFFKANKNIINRKILLLFDNDCNTPDQDYGQLSVRTLPQNKDNKIATLGIENLLSEDCLTPEFYQEKTKTKPDGGSSTTTTLRKTDLCNYICENGQKNQVIAFEPAMKIIEDFLKNTP